MTLEIEPGLSRSNEHLSFNVPEGGDPVRVFKDMLSAKRDGCTMGSGGVTWFGDREIFTKEGWVPLTLGVHTLEDLIAGRATGCYEVNSRTKDGSSQTIILLLGGKEIYRVERFHPTVRQKLLGSSDLAQNNR